MMLNTKCAVANSMQNGHTIMIFKDHFVLDMLTLKLIFILYSTPSFRTKACFFNASRSPVTKQKWKKTTVIFFTVVNTTQNT